MWIFCISLNSNFFFILLPHFPKKNRLRGFLSIDIDISELYINQCDINNEFYSDIHYSNFRNNKFTFDYSHDDQQENIQQQYYSHHLIPLKQQSSQFQLDNEIDAFHGSHKCHRVEMDVSALSGGYC